MTATLLASELARVIDDAAIFASRDTGLPVINAVCFESSAKTLIATATDRFVLGSTMAQYNDDDGATFTAILRLSQAQMISKVAKSTRAAFTDVAIKADEGTMTFAFSSGETLSLPKMTESSAPFPDWRKIIETRAGEEGSTQLIAVNPQYMAKFGRVTDARRMKVRIGKSNTPVLVSIGSQFVGVVMPVRLPDDDSSTWETPDWMARPQPSKSKRAQSKTPVAKKVPA